MPVVTSDHERPLDDGDYVSLAEFRAALRRFLAFSEAVARDHGLTPAQHQLLLAARGAEATGDAPSMSDLAERLQIQLHSVGELVARAIEHDMVERRADPHDARRVLVATTPTGRRLLDELTQLHRQELRRFRAEMNELLGSVTD